MSKDQNNNQRIIGRWFIGETLGKGGYSFVKKGTDVKTGKMVALKFMEKADSSWLKEQAKQVETEIGALKNIKHKNVMKLYAYNLNAQYPSKEKNVFKETILLVLEFAPCGELFDILYYTSKLDPLVSRTYFRQLIDAVEACHKANVIHRDLKPQNLLLDSKYNLKITDFGLSKLIQSEDDSKMNTYYVGTRGYQAPELVLKKEYDWKCDIFSCGVILFILLSGYPPFEQAAKEDKWFKPLIKKNYEKFWKCHHKANSYKIEEAKKLLQQMMAFNPKDRSTINEIKTSGFFKGEVLKQSDLIKHLKDRYKKTEVKRLNDISKQNELVNSFLPDDKCRDVIKDGFCEIHSVPDNQIYNPIYTYGDKNYWKQVYGAIILQITKEEGKHLHNKKENLLELALNIEGKGQVEFTFKVFYSNTYHEKHEDLTSDEAYIFIIETKRINGDVFLYHAILKNFLFSGKFSKIIKGLPNWVNKIKINNKDVNDDEKEQKEAEDDYYKICEKIDYK